MITIHAFLVNADMFIILALLECLADLWTGQFAECRLLQESCFEWNDLVWTNSAVGDDSLRNGCSGLSSCYEVGCVICGQVYNHDDFCVGVFGTIAEDDCVCWSHTGNVRLLNGRLDTLRLKVQPDTR